MISLGDAVQGERACYDGMLHPRNRIVGDVRLHGKVPLTSLHDLMHLGSHCELYSWGDGRISKCGINE